MNSIAGFFSVANCLATERANEIYVVFADFGSDKEFWFSSAIEVLQQLKSILTTVFDKLLFYRESKAEKRLRLVAEALPVMIEIRAKREQLGDKQAKLLEQVVVESLEQFVRARPAFIELDVSPGNQMDLLANYVNEAEFKDEILTD